MAPEDWLAFVLTTRQPISWDQYERNQAQLAANRAWTAEARGAVPDGSRLARRAW